MKNITILNGKNMFQNPHTKMFLTSLFVDLQAIGIIS